MKRHTGFTKGRAKKIVRPTKEEITIAHEAQRPAQCVLCGYVGKHAPDCLEQIREFFT